MNSLILRDHDEAFGRRSRSRGRRGRRRSSDFRLRRVSRLLSRDSRQSSPNELNVVGREQSSFPRCVRARPPA